MTLTDNCLANFNVMSFLCKKLDLVITLLQIDSKCSCIKMWKIFVRMHNQRTTFMWNAFMDCRQASAMTRKIMCWQSFVRSKPYCWRLKAERPLSSLRSKLEGVLERVKSLKHINFNGVNFTFHLLCSILWMSETCLMHVFVWGMSEWIWYQAL